MKIHDGNGLRPELHFRWGVIWEILNQGRGLAEEMDRYWLYMRHEYAAERYLLTAELVGAWG